MSDAAFYSHRRALSKRDPKREPKPIPSSSGGILPESYRIHHRSNPQRLEQMEKVALFIQNNPDAKPSKCPLKVTTSTFSYIRNILKKTGKLNGTVSGGTSTKKKTAVYMPVFSTSSQIPEVAKQVLRDFVNTLNDTKRAKFEIVEYADPKEIEVREVQ